MKSILQTDDKCYLCHDDVHFDKDTSAELMCRLHKDGQEAYERTHTRDEFMARYGRNYL